MIASRWKKAGRLTILSWSAFLAVSACSMERLTPLARDGLQLEEDEMRLWREARELQNRFDRSGLLYEDTPITAYVNQVGAKIMPVEIAKEIHFEIKILKHPAPNAFALPHGVLYIHTGFLARTENEAQLAALIGHETTHVIYRHTLETFRNVKQAAAFASSLGVISAPAGLYGLGVSVLGTIGMLAAVSGYSQSLEEDADREGLRLMVNAGYDPGEAPKIMENLKRHVEEEEIKEPFFFSSHPRLEERRDSYQRLLDTEYRGRAGWRGDEDFTVKIAPVILENALLEMARGRFAVAQEGIEKILKFKPDDCKGRFALAELFRQRGAEGDQQKAEREYQIAIDLAPQFAEPHRGIALVYYKTHRTALAGEHFRKYLELNPGAKDRAYIEQYLREIEAGGAY